MSETNNKPLVLPALRANMGDWIYYICFLKMKDIADRISIVEEIHSSQSLRDLLQRQLSDRSTDIKEYLLMQKQRFFNALVVGTYGGQPQWYEFDVRQTELVSVNEVQDYIQDTIGILKLNGEEQLFAIDGQHRVAGIREAVKEDPELLDEEVCVIFVSGVTADNRNSDPSGFERTRRLFTTLNRYAKPVSQKDVIALDEDDIVAIVTRYLVEDHPLFSNRISVKRTKSLPSSDQSSFTTIITLYNVMDIWLQDKGGKEWDKFKRKRPSEELEKHFIQTTNMFWDAMIAAFRPLKHLSESIHSETLVQYRNRDGGHLLFRPIGLLTIARAVRLFVDNGIDFQEAVLRISHVPMQLSEEPWVSLLWDNQNKRMMTASERQRAGVRLLYHGAGGRLEDIKYSEQELVNELAGLLNTEVEKIALDTYL